MYKFLGYMIKNDLGDCVQFVKTREEGIQICNQNNLPVTHLHQIFENYVEELVTDITPKEIPVIQ